MDRIPPLGWAALAFVLILFIGINVNLFTMLRDLNKQGARKMKVQRPGPMMQSLQKARDLLRDPILDEREQLEELSNLVHALQAKPPGGENETGEADPNRPKQ